MKLLPIPGHVPGFGRMLALMARSASIATCARTGRTLGTCSRRVDPTYEFHFDKDEMKRV